MSEDILLEEEQNAIDLGLHRCNNCKHFEVKDKIADLGICKMHTDLKEVCGYNWCKDWYPIDEDVR